MGGWCTRGCVTPRDMGLLISHQMGDHKWPVPEWGIREAGRTGVGLDLTQHPMHTRVGNLRDALCLGLGAWETVAA